MNGWWSDAQSGYKYATIDGTPHSSTSGGCSVALNLPTGWELAPSDSDGIRMATVGVWGTYCLVYSDGEAYYTTYWSSQKGSSCGSGRLTTSTLNGAAAYGVSECDGVYRMRVLIRVSTGRFLWKPSPSSPSLS